MEFEYRVRELDGRAVVDLLDVAGWLSSLATANLLSPLSSTQGSHLEVAAYLSHVANLLREAEKAFFAEDKAQDEPLPGDPSISSFSPPPPAAYDPRVNP